MDDFKRFNLKEKKRKNKSSFFCFSSSYHRVVITSLPHGTDREKLESLLSSFSNLQIVDIKEEANNVCTANVNFQSKDDADK
jgi:hypothetical protein